MAIIGVVGGSQVFSQASGGKIYAFNNLATAPQVVAPVNTNRQKITFHNPGAIDIYVAPSVALSSNGSNVTLVPSLTSLGGCWRLFSDGGTLELSGECQGSWQAFAVSGAANPLTVMDTNLS